MSSTVELFTSCKGSLAIRKHATMPVRELDAVSPSDEQMEPCTEANK
jgi:hypothetical protein